MLLGPQHREEPGPRADASLEVQTGTGGALARRGSRRPGHRRRLAWVDSQDTETPRASLDRHDAGPAARQLDAITALDPRNAGNTYLSAGALLHTYRYPDVHREDGQRLTARGFLDGAPHTLYVIAPDGDQRLLAPLFVALVASIFHTAADVARTRGALSPPLRVLLDEAANIAPLRDLPRHL